MAKKIKASTPDRVAEILASDPTLISADHAVSSEGLTPIFNPQFSYQIAEVDAGEAAGAAIRVLRALSERRKNRASNFKTLSEVKASYLPLHHFALQHLFGCLGLPKGTLGTLTADESTGKTTMVFEMLGAAMRQGCPGVYIETENKPMPMERAKRCLSNNRDLSERLAANLLWVQAFSLKQFEDVLTDSIDAYRGRLNSKDKKEKGIAVPLDTPILVVCDVWSRLMSEAEAEGFYAYGKSAEKFKNEDCTEVGGGSNLNHAKWAHAFARRLPAFLATNNVILICCNHQTTKINMTAGSRPVPDEVSALFNKTARGGRAFNHLAAWQMTLAKSGQFKQGENVIGNRVTMRMAKQSYGPEGRRIVGILRTEMQGDTSVFQESAMDLDLALCDLLIEGGLCGLSVESKRYSSKELGIFGGSAHDVAVAFHNNRASVINSGKRLRIEGYADYFPEDIKSGAIDVTASVPKGLRVQPGAIQESEEDTE